MLRPLLSPSQRSQLFTISADILEQDLVRRYTFSPADLSLINRQREGYNRLGFAVQLAYLRFPGRPLQAAEEPPAPLLSYIAAQLRLSPLVFRHYGKRHTTRRQHALKIQRYLQLHQLTRKDERVLQTLLVPTALETGSNFAVVAALLDHMHQQRIVIPAASTVEKLAYVIQEEARRILLSELTAHLTTEHTEKLDGLLSLRDRIQTYLVWLKNFPRRPTPQSVLSVVDRIDYIDGLKLPPRSSNLYDNRISRLAREGMRHTPQYVERLVANRRHGLLIAIVTELRKDLIDQAILMDDKMMGQFFNRSQWQQKEAFHKRGKAINDKVRLYEKIGKALIQAKESSANWEDAIASVIPWEKYRASVAEAETLVMGENFDFLENLRGRYSYLRQYVPRLMTTLHVQATPAGQPLLGALNLLKQLNAEGRRTLPPDAPAEFITQRWEPYIFQGSSVNRQYYELHALAELRARLRSGDLYVEASRTHKEFDMYVLPPADWERVKSSGQIGLAVTSDWDTYIAGRSSRLHQRLTYIDRQTGSGRLPEVTLTDRRLHIAQPEKSVPEAALTLAQRAYSLVPPVKLTDLLVEVDS